MPGEPPGWPRDERPGKCTGQFQDGPMQDAFKIPKGRDPARSGIRRSNPDAPRQRRPKTKAGRPRRRPIIQSAPARYGAPAFRPPPSARVKGAEGQRCGRQLAPADVRAGAVPLGTGVGALVGASGAKAVRDAPAAQDGGPDYPCVAGVADSCRFDATARGSGAASVHTQRSIRKPLGRKEWQTPPTVESGRCHWKTPTTAK